MFRRLIVFVTIHLAVAALAYAHGVIAGADSSASSKAPIEAKLGALGYGTFSWDREVGLPTPATGDALIEKD